MRIAFVNSVSRNSFGYHKVSVKFPPLGLQVLAARTPKHHDMTLYDEVLGRSPLIQHLKEGRIDLVALTCYTSGAPHAYEIAAVARAVGVPTIIGGVHASSCPEEAGRYVDSVAIGECDDIWPDILGDAERNVLKPIYHGSLANLAAGSVGRGRQSLKPINGRYDFACIQTSRGCPVGCKYCSVTSFNGAAIRRREPLEIVDEWNTMTGFRTFVVDDNFFGVSKKDADWAKQFCVTLARKGRRRIWLSQTTLNMGDDAEGLRLAYKAGCRVMLIGFESFDASNLKQYKKGINNKNLSRYKELVDNFHRQGIAIIGAFIIGADHDDGRTADATRRMALDIGIDMVQMTNLTPLPGTPMLDEFRQEGRLVTSDYPNDWERHSFQESVFRPQNMTRYELDYSLHHCRATSFQGRDSIFRRALRTFWRTRSLETAVYVYHANLGYRQMARELTQGGRERFQINPKDGGKYTEEVS